MDSRDSYKDDPAVPERLREALAQNGAALDEVAAMTEEERRTLYVRAEAVSDPAEMVALVNSVVGSQIGHPPYQL